MPARTCFLVFLLVPISLAIRLKKRGSQLKEKINDETTNAYGKRQKSVEKAKLIERSNGATELAILEASIGQPSEAEEHQNTREILLEAQSRNTEVSLVQSDFSQNLKTKQRIEGNTAYKADIKKLVETSSCSIDAVTKGKVRSRHYFRVNKKCFESMFGSIDDGESVLVTHRRQGTYQGTVLVTPLGSPDSMGWDPNVGASSEDWYGHEYGTSERLMRQWQVKDTIMKAPPSCSIDAVTKGTVRSRHYFRVNKKCFESVFGEGKSVLVTHRRQGTYQGTVLVTPLGRPDSMRWDPNVGTANENWYGHEYGKSEPNMHRWEKGDAIVQVAISDIQPHCKPVFDALLVNDITSEKATWDNALVPDDQLLTFLNAVDGPENPLFKGANPLEHSKWRVAMGRNNMSYKMQNTDALVEIEFPTHRDVMVVGDLHGRLGTLRRIYQKWSKEGMPYVVGVGDMVDRGNRQVEVVAGFLAWRCMHPDKVMVLHGNHERMDVNKRYGLPCVDKVGPYKGMGLHKKLNSIFDKIPTALVAKQPEQYKEASGVFVHGSFGRIAFDASQDASHTREVEEKALEQMQWNELDPEMSQTHPEYFLTGRPRCYFDKPDTWFKPSPRGRRFRLFCDLIGHHFLKNLEACTLFTGHSHFNVQHFETIAAPAKKPTNESRRDVAARAGCPKMQHFVTLSANRFQKDCYLPKTMQDPYRDCQGRVTMVRTHDSDSDPRVEISQEPIFGYQANMAPSQQSAAEKTLDVGVGSGQYPVWPACDVQPKWTLGD